MFCSTHRSAYSFVNLTLWHRVSWGAVCGRKQSVFLLSYGQGQRHATTATMDPLLPTRYVIVLHLLYIFDSYGVF